MLHKLQKKLFTKQSKVNLINLVSHNTRHFVLIIVMKYEK